MATAASAIDYSTKVLKEGLTCYICYDILREPKDLECPHVFCLLCLQEWVKKKFTIDCPECHYISIVPQGGLGNLKTNLRLKIMAEKYVKGVEKKKGVSMCPRHEGEQQHFFCVTCGITVCRGCLVLDYPRPQHDIKQSKVITKTRKAEIKRKMDHVVGEIKKTKKRKAETKLQGATEKDKRNIKKCVQQGWCDQGQNLTTFHKKQNHTEGTIKRLQNVVDTAADHNLIQKHASLVDHIDRLSAQANIHQRKAPSMDMDLIQVNPGSSLQNTSQVAPVGAFRLPPWVQAATCQSEVPSLDVDSDQFNPGSSLQNISQVAPVGALRLPPWVQASTCQSGVPSMNVNSVHVNPLPSMNVNSVQVNSVPTMNMDSVQVNQVPSMNVNSTQANPVPSMNVNSIQANPVPSMNVNSVQVNPVPSMNVNSVQVNSVPLMNIGSVQVNPVLSMNMDSVRVNPVLIGLLPKLPTQERGRMEPGIPPFLTGEESGRNPPSNLSVNNWGTIESELIGQDAPMQAK